MNWYNEFDPAAADWLDQLIIDGLIPAGVVDRRSIVDVSPDDLVGFTQCHFFAGIGGWPLALRLAGWPEDRPVWTASLPCQPWSNAGLQRGAEDERHLAPVWLELVAARKPARIYGEQVATAAVFGRMGGKSLHPLWRTTESLQFLKDSIDRELEKRVSILSEQTRSGEAFCAPQHHALSRAFDAIEREIASSEAECSVRSGLRFSQGEAGRGSLRSDQNSVLHGIETGMGVAFDGPDQPTGGIHEIEREDGPVFCEHGFLRLGAGEVEASSTRDLADANRKIERAIEENLREIERSPLATWWDSLRFNLERAHYACGASDLPAASIGTPHIRQRTWFVAQRLAHGLGARLEGHAGHGDGGRQPGRDDAHAPRSAWPGGDTGRLADADGGQSRQAGAVQPSGQHGQQPQDGGVGDRPDAHHSGWANPDWLLCRDGKWRPVESSVLGVASGVSESLVSGSYPLAQGQEARTTRLRGYGNAIVPQLAAEWIRLTDELV